MKLVIALIIKTQVFFSLVSAASFDINFDDFQVAAKRLKRATGSTCLLPPETPDKIYTVKFAHEKVTSHPKPGKVVPAFTIIVSRCSRGYVAGYQANDSYVLPSVCTSNSWAPPVLKCKRTCNNFSHLRNFHLSCYKYLKGPKISCTGQLLKGAIVIPRCQTKFHINYDYATCREDGTWDESSFKCIPDCGAIASSSVSLIANGYPEKRGGAPWNVAIYSTQLNSKIPEFICGGTLINAELVISAAHCFYDEVFHKSLDIKFFYIIVAKATRDYKKQDFESTKTYRLKNIYFPDTMFRGSATNYASDIVILQLSEHISFSKDVFPACINLDDRERFNPGENVTGKLSGFGATANGFTSVTALLSANLPYISYNECLKKVRDDFLSSISVDKFCAGSAKGPGARSGDSGGGLLFMDKATGLYYLRGVVSNKDLSESSIATFTDVAQYMPWISKTIHAVRVDSEISLRLLTSSLHNTRSQKTPTTNRYPLPKVRTRNNFKPRGRSSR